MVKFHSFLWPSNMAKCIYIYTHIYISHIFLHLSIDEHWSGFHILAIVNKAAMNMEMNVPFQISVLVFFRYIPRGGTAGLYNSIFSFLRKLHTIFHSGLHQFTFPPTRNINLLREPLINFPKSISFEETPPEVSVYTAVSLQRPLHFLFKEGVGGC